MTAAGNIIHAHIRMPTESHHSIAYHKMIFLAVAYTAAAVNS